MRRVLRLQAGPVGQVAFDPSGRTLAGGYGDGTIVLWDVATGDRVGTLRGNAGSVESMAFDPIGRRLVSGGGDGTVRLWNLRTHAEVDRPLRGWTRRRVRGGVQSRRPRNRSGRRRQSDTAVERSDRAPARHPGDRAGKRGLQSPFSPKGRELASGGADDTIHLWRIGPHSYTQAATLTGNTDFVRSVAFSPDGKTLASGGTDNTVRLWDVATGTEFGRPLNGHIQSVESVAFSPDGRLLVSGSRDSTVRVWEGVTVPPSFAQLRQDVCSFLGAGLSRAEWLQYAPDIPYQQTCPRTTPS